MNVIELFYVVLFVLCYIILCYLSIALRMFDCYISGWV